VDGAETVVTLKKEGFDDVAYKFIVYSARYTGMPDRVVDYLSIASQYTNGGNTLNRFVGMNAVGTLLGRTGTGSSGGTTNPALDAGPFSLGGYGGFVTYYYESAITDDPKNPYGVDFIVFGNSEDGGRGFAEPGSVLVSEDGTDWYYLAGSQHYEDTTLWNHSVTYTNVGGKAAWTDTAGDSGTPCMRIRFRTDTRCSTGRAARNPSRSEVSQSPHRTAPTRSGTRTSESAAWQIPTKKCSNVTMPPGIRI
jgi:hypothetical protein